jgi:hypothetical protein
LWILSLALLWRLAAWRVRPAAALIEDEGLLVGSEAPQVAAHRGDQDAHLGFVGRTSFVVFGQQPCEPCNQLLEVAAWHPATRHMRLVYLSDSDDVLGVEPQVKARWEMYRLHDSQAARAQWRAPVNPYFHVVDEDGRILAKGVANRAEHLDRLLSLRPPGIARGVTVHGSPQREGKSVAGTR